MDPMVSARVPMELRDQVNEGLRAIGSSPTELINRAYEYFLDTKKLPGREVAAKKGKRQLTASQLRALAKSIEETTYIVPESYFEGLDYKQILERELRESYEALA